MSTPTTVDFSGTPLTGNIAPAIAVLGTSTGPVLPLPPRRTGPIRLSELQTAQAIYLNDVITLFQGNPPIARQATILAALTATNAGTPTNTELLQVPADQRISDLPLASSTYLTDWVLVNQGTPPQTRRSRLSQLASVINVDFVGKPLSGSLPLTVVFTDLTATTPSAWLWSFGDGNTSTVQNPSNAYLLAGTYTVSLTATVFGTQITTTKVAYVAVAGPCEPYYSNAVLILNAGGTAGSTSFIDSSLSSHTMTTSGGPVLSGANGMVFNGSGTSSTPTSADWDLAASNGWTIEFWMKSAGTVAFGIMHTEGSNTGWGIRLSNSFIQLIQNGVAYFGSAAAYTVYDNVFHHIAFIAKPAGPGVAVNTIQLYLDGVLINTSTNLSNPTFASQPLVLGQSSFSSPFIGTLAGVRITQAVARYFTSSPVGTQVFTPPSFPYPIIQC